MNKDRRQQIVEAGGLVSAIAAAVSAAREAIEQIRDEEQESYDALPDGFKQSERGQISEAAIAALEDATNAIDQIDTADIRSALEEAADRSVEAETVSQRTTRKEADARRWARLPGFAKDRMAQLEAKIALLEKKSASPFPDPTGDVEEIVVYDVMEGPLHGNALPTRYVESKAHGIRIECDSRGVLLHADRRLVIHPNSGNEAIVKSEEWR